MIVRKHQSQTEKHFEKTRSKLKKRKNAKDGGRTHERLRE